MSFLLRYSYDCCTADEPFAKCYDYTTAQKDSQSYKQGFELINEDLAEFMLADGSAMFFNLRAREIVDFNWQTGGAHGTADHLPKRPISQQVPVHAVQQRLVNLQHDQIQG